MILQTFSLKLRRAAECLSSHVGKWYNLAVFSGDAHITVAPWPLISVGQKYWLSVVGTLAQDSSPYTIVVAQGEVVSLSEQTVGLNKILARSELGKLLANSTLSVQLNVLFDSNSVDDAVLFPKLDNIKIVIEAPFLNDVTDFKYGLNGWTLGPASYGGVFEHSDKFGVTVFANNTDTNANYAGEIMFKEYTFIVGRTYYLAVYVCNYTGSSGIYQPVIQICSSEAASPAITLPVDGYMHALECTFVATVPNQRIYISNQTASGNGNDSLYNFLYVVQKTLRSWGRCYSTCCRAAAS